LSLPREISAPNLRSATWVATMCGVAIQGASRSGMVTALMRASLAAVVCCALLAGFAGAAQAQLSWSGPIGVDKVSGLSLTVLACPSATQCTALDTYGRVLTFN